MNKQDKSRQIKIKSSEVITMKRVSEINERIKFDNTKIGGMKEIMIKAHALAHLTCGEYDSYKKAFQQALKIVWRLIKKADRKQKRVYIYTVNGRYAFAETRMDISDASDYFCMIDAVDKRCESAVRDVEKDDMLFGSIHAKEKLRLVILEYIGAWLPQLRAVENYNKNVGMPDFTIDDELRAFINAGHYKAVCSTVKEVLIQFIFEYGFTTRCRIKNYISSYGLDD